MIKLKVQLKKLNQDELNRLVLESNKLPRDTPFDVYFSDKKAVRTMPQNRYLWGVVYKALTEVTGYDVEEIHEICKAKCALRTSFDLGIHGILETPQSTRMMDTRQMSEYIEKVRKWSQETLGVYIPQPNEITEEQFLNSHHYL